MRQFHFFTFCLVAIGKDATTRDAPEIGVNYAVAFDGHNFVECVKTFKGVATVKHAAVVHLAQIFFYVGTSECGTTQNDRNFRQPNSIQLLQVFAHDECALH